MTHFNLSEAIRWSLSGVASLALATSLPALSMAASDPAGHYTDMVTPNGKADWTTGVVTARGIGVPPKNPANALQSREMTRTAAWSVALRNLLEVVNGVYVDPMRYLSR